MSTEARIAAENFSLKLVPPAKPAARRYENRTGLTDPQRQLLHAITKDRGNFLQEITRHNGRKMFRCYTKAKMMVLPTPDFHRVVVLNLVSKGFLVARDGRYFLK